MAPARYIISLLTVFPVGRRPIEMHDGDIGWAMSLAPLAGLLVWLPAGGVMYAARVLLDGSDSLLVPTLGLGVVALLTGGLHLDGLADVGDAIGSRKPAAQALAIMKDPHIGALGAASVFFVVLAQIGALGLSISRHHGTVTLLTAILAGRLAVVLACRPGIPAASSEGLGARVIGSVSRLRACAVTLAVLLIAIAGGKLEYDGGRFRESAHAVVSIVAAIVVAEVVRRLLVRRFGGLSGDMFGALTEVAVLADLLLMAARAPMWLH
ncbi:MAG: cobalamin 5-phosphate synthase [Mycobacterium sp.]|nr:cobalamin 5-phosphate synthase [Mycobacterium sp.]